MNTEFVIGYHGFIMLEIPSLMLPSLGNSHVFVVTQVLPTSFKLGSWLPYYEASHFYHAYGWWLPC